MNILAYDPFISEEKANELGVRLMTVHEIVKEADFITVHTPLTKDTRNIIDKREFEMMKSNARIINCARGGIINEEALAEALKSGKVAGAAIDVFVNEPPFESPMLECDNLIATPHLGASTEEAQVNVAISVAEEVVAVLGGGVAKNAINIPSVKPEVMAVLAPFMQLAETMSKACAQLLGKNYEKIEISYQGDIAGKDTRPVTVAAVKGMLQVALGSAVNYVNANSLAKSRKVGVIESKSQTADEYASIIRITITKGNESQSITGTVIGNAGKIIGINEEHVDIAPSGYIIVAKHINKPNVIGPCCIVLGKNNINISGMQVGRVPIGDVTIMALNVDSEVSEPILQEMRSVEGILDAKLIKL
jgi:D-3-phosphoglycerate dehydrogenase